MGDPLSIAASVVGLVSTGFAIAKGLYKVADVLASSGKEIRAYGSELDGFTKLLNLIHLELVHPAHSNSNVLIFRGIADICAGVLEPFSRLQQTLERLTSRFQFEQSRWKILCRRIQWVFEKEKGELLFWRDLLAQQHRNLDSALLVLVLQRNREGSAQIKHLLETTLQKSVVGVSIPENGIIQDVESRNTAGIGSGSNHLEQTSLLNSASQVAQSTIISGGASQDQANDVETDINLGVTIQEIPTRTSPSGAVSSLALTTMNNETSVTPWGDIGSITDEEIDEVIQRCLDPDEGMYMHSVEKHVTEMSQAIQVIALQVLHARNQNPFNLREQVISLAGGRYMIGIVCASAVQVAAVRSMMTEIKPPSTSNAFHDIVYVFGRMADHEVALTCLPRDGDNRNAEHEASKVFENMFQSFPSMLFAISVGTASACPYSGRDIRLGDVVIGRPKRSGEAILLCAQDGKTFHFSRRTRLPDVVLTGIRILQAQHEYDYGNLNKFMRSALEEYPRMAKTYAIPQVPDLLFKTGGNGYEPVERQARDDDEPLLHYGPIASIQRSVINSYTRDKIAADTGVFCIDCEGSEVSCEFPVLVVRGMIDYADGHAGTNWVRYAALTAAAYVKELLVLLPQSSLQS